jgi:4-amino-4-deoxy-L-arabinose transferase-like glycosyltransferase
MTVVQQGRHTQLVLPAMIAVLAAPVLFLDLDTPAFVDHEGRYAEVAREMLLSGDWVTPRLNDTVFLTKPPLTYWLTALTFQLVGTNEYGRVWAALVGLGLLVVTFLLGRTLGGPRAGFLSGLALLTSAGFFLESRTVRPDLLMTLLMSAALLGFLKAHDAPSDMVRARWAWLIALTLALSVMAKGLVGMVLVGGTVGLAFLLCGRLSFLRQIRWGTVVAIALAVVLPWYILAGLRNEGFWWDSLVNQHVLRLFNSKFPRDTEPVSLLVFWGAFLGRTFPWCVFLPVAILRAIAIMRQSRTPGAVLPLAWLGVVVIFFSISPARLEHYSIPALPAVALLVGSWWAEAIEKGGVRSLEKLLPAAGLAVAGLGGFLVGPKLVGDQPWAADLAALTRAVPLVSSLILFSAGTTLWSLWQGRPQLAVAALVMVMLTQFVFIHQALTVLDPVRSWKAVGAHVARIAPKNTEVIFAASEEYQLCAGLEFYSGKPLTILLPDGFTPPSYLGMEHHSRFLTRTEFRRRWQENRPLLLVVDPHRAEKDPAAFVPNPAILVNRWGNRLLLANPAFVEITRGGPDRISSLALGE